jgi:hypothetical protein
MGARAFFVVLKKGEFLSCTKLPGFLSG